ncbi:MAG: aminopeptidase, partial [Gemmatimonadaceae bacterium]
ASLHLQAQAAPVNWPSVATKLVERMQLTRGERVFLLGVPGQSDSLVSLLRTAIRNAGGVDLGALSTTSEEPIAWATEFTRASHGRTGASLEALLHEADLGVMLPGATTTDAPYAAMQAVLRSGKGRTIHFHWAGAYGMDGTELPVDNVRSSLYERVLLETDYAALAGAQRAIDAAMRGRTVRVTTPEGTDISFEIGDRQVTKQDGDVSLARANQARNLIDREVELPAGAIRVAPVESSVNGAIAFPPSVWGGERVEGLVMTFRAGRVVSYQVQHGRAGVERELAAGGPATRAFREFALGLNPLLAIPQSGERWIPYYGYGAGVVRLSLGDNTELGGTVSGGYVRWNFFPDATVRVGNDIWVQDGRLRR